MRKKESPGSIFAKLLQAEDPVAREKLSRKLEEKSREVLERGVGPDTEVSVKVS
jgi:hypothetical protein